MTTEPTRLLCEWCGEYRSRRAVTVVSCDQCGWRVAVCAQCSDPKWMQALLVEHHEKRHTAQVATRGAA